MALRTTRTRRPRSRRGNLSYLARRSLSQRARRSGLGGPGPSLEIQPVWFLLGAIAIFAISLPWLGPLLVEGLEDLLRIFGLGLPLTVAVAGVDVWLAWKRPVVLTRTFFRIWGGLHLLVITAFGILGFMRPGWGLGDASFAEATAGGAFGHLFAGNPLGILLWLGASSTGAGLLWPRGARLAGLGLLAGLRALAAMDLPARAWEGLKTFFTTLVPQKEPDEERVLDDTTYVPKWDEEWQETPQPAVTITHEGEPSEEGEDAAEPVVVTSEPEEKPPVFQRSLPMGRPAGHGWELPPVDLLNEVADEEIRPLDNEARAQLIVDTLKSFGVDARVVSINQGPAVTQFGVEPGWEVKTRTVMERDERSRPVYDKDGKPRYKTEIVSRTRVRVSQITSLANDLSLALAAPSIRIEAPVPGKPIVGIEVPNTFTSLVTLRSVIESTAFQRLSARSRLAIGLGKGVSGEPAAADLAKMPHLLIAGATGSGKSVCINSVIGCILMHNTPEDIRFILIDPKRVELANLASIPHLAFSRVVTDVDDVVGTLQAVLHEMESRYRKFAALGVRNVEAYNRSPKAPMKLQYWVVIIDELADLMMAAPYQVEKQICRLAQLARATGIHLIIATQRPSVDVVTGLIKANFPTRIAFAVSSQVDSRTIIDGAGAEKLLGRGDMLFMPTDASKPKRLQGCFVSDAELDRIVAWWTDERFRHLKPDAMDHLLQEAKTEDEEAEGEEEDPLFEAAKELALQHNRISTSLLQRRLHVGYPRAARLVDLLEEEGIVGPSEGGGASRRVLIDQDELDTFE
ncbi:MAG: DNA translocase FtsK [Chloroflexi bacterium]|nr:DNA translocase FtsK [Chloroflexota bacterium]